MGVSHRIDLILPCLDEAAALPWVLSRIPPDAKAIVVDNGSRDGSAQVARALGAQVVACDQRGYGAACHAGLLAARAELVAFCDCDASLDPLDVEVLVAQLDSGADLVVGRRRASGLRAWPPHARLANVALARRVRSRTGLVIRDVGPIRVAGRESLRSLGIRDRRNGYPVETLIRAAHAGWRVAQVDVAYRPRVGRSKVTGTVRGTVRAVRDISAVLAQ